MNVKEQFPIFQNNPGLIYLDNSATTQKPQRVIDAVVDYYSKYNSNVHRGLYPLSEKSTGKYESARKIIAEFLNAEPEEIIFTSGTTDGINSIAESLKLSGMISNNPEILLTELEHHSNILPWQRITTQLEYLELDEDEQLLIKAQKDEYDIISTTLVSNVTGTINDIHEISKINHKILIIDAAQAIAHLPIDVKTLGADFIVFSGHKMYGPTGVGVIWGRKELLEKMEPFRVGGGMINEVKRDSATWAEIPEKFEAGTPPIAQVIGLAEAANFLKDLRFEEIEKHEQHLRKYLIENLQQIENIKIYHPDLSKKAVGVISFTVEGIHPHDLSQFLGDRNICVRAGHHCTQILHREVLEIPASVRVSLAIYNTEEDIDKLINEIISAKQYYLK